MKAASIWTACLAVGALLLWPGVTSAGAGIWSSVGPPGGSIWALEVDPRSPSTMYAGAWRGGVFKSTDAGASWTAVGPFDQIVFSIAVDPKDSRIVYAGTYDGLFKSRDAGLTWQLLDGIIVPYPHFDTGPPAFLASQSQAIVFDPQNLSTVYLGTVNDVFISLDDGETFTALQAPFYMVQSLAVDFQASGTMLAGAGLEQGLFKTVDGGKTWKTMASLPFSVNRVVFDPTNGSIAYAATDQGLYKSGNGGESWSPVGSPTLSGHVKDVLVDARDPRRIVACAEWQNVYESLDGGATWAFPGGSVAPTYINKLAMPAVAALLYAATDNGVFQSESVAGSWSASSRGLNASLVLALAEDVSSPGTIFAGTVYDGLYRSPDGGESWEAAALQAEGGEILQILVNPRETQTVYVQTPLSVFRSTDGANTWSASFTAPESDNLKVLALSAADPETLYVVSGHYFENRSRVFKTTNGGASWGLVADLAVDFWSLAIDPRSSQILFAGTIPNDPVTGGVLKSMDGGATWIPLNDGFLPSDLPGIDSLVIDPQDSSVLYAAAGLSRAGGQQGVFKSTDGGSHWARTIQGLTNLYVLVLAVHPSNPSIVFAGTDKGLFVSRDAGASWALMNEGLVANASVRSILFSANEGKIRIGTLGGGVFERDISLRFLMNRPLRDRGPIAVPRR